MALIPQGGFFNVPFVPPIPGRPDDAVLDTRTTAEHLRVLLEDALASQINEIGSAASALAGRINGRLEAQVQNIENAAQSLTNIQASSGAGTSSVPFSPSTSAGVSAPLAEVPALTPPEVTPEGVVIPPQTITVPEQSVTVPLPGDTMVGGGSIETPPIEPGITVSLGQGSIAVGTAGVFLNLGRVSVQRDGETIFEQDPAPIDLTPLSGTLQSFIIPGTTTTPEVGSQSIPIPSQTIPGPGPQTVTSPSMSVTTPGATVPLPSAPGGTSPFGAGPQEQEIPSPALPVECKAGLCPDGTPMRKAGWYRISCCRENGIIESVEYYIPGPWCPAFGCQYEGPLDANAIRTR